MNDITNNTKTISENKEKLDIAFFACLFYYFIEYFRPQNKYAIFKDLHLGDLAVAIFVICFFLAGKRFIVKNRINRLVTIYFLWCFICSYIGINFAESWTFIIYFFKFYLVYFLTINTITNERQLIWFIFFIGVMYFSYTNFVARNWIFSGLSVGIRGSYYGAGFFHNPNDMSAALSSFFGLSLYMIYADKYRLFNKFPNKWFHVINTVLILLGVLLTSTRGGAVALAACFLYFWKKQGFKIRYAILILLIAVTFASMLSPAQWEKFENIGTEKDKTGQSRLDNWKVAWKMMNDYPIFGVGPWNYVQAKKEIYHETENLFVQHNIFFQASTELGYPGLFILLCLIYSFYKTTSQVKRLDFRDSKKTYFYISQGVELSMVGFIFSGMFITTLYYPFFWLNLAFAVSLNNIAMSKYAESKT